MLGAAVGLAAASAAASPAAAQINFRGCFVSGPNLDGTPNAEFDGDVNTLTSALLSTGSWTPGGITSLFNGQLADIFGCITDAKNALAPGDEFVFYFAGHGGNNRFPNPGEAGDAGGDEALGVGPALGDDSPAPLTDDALAAQLSGFRASVTISVILDACHSWAFGDGANDLGSVTQRGDAGPVPAGSHLALSTSTSPATPLCSGGYTAQFSQGISTGAADADTNGVITTQEATDYARGFRGTGRSRCWLEGESCPAPTDSQAPSYLGPNNCDRRVDVCPVVATVPEPSTTLLTTCGLVALGATLRRSRSRRLEGRPRPVRPARQRATETTTRA